MTKTSSSQLVALRTQHHAALGELERYKLLVESVQDYAIFLLDADGYVATWNKGAERFKGYKANEIIGKHFSTFYVQQDKDAHKPERELELATKHGRVEDEDWRVRKDGSKFWANVVITALHDPDGELVGFAKVTRDLTERKHQEDAMRKANLLLKRQQIELRKLNTSKDEFISLASHQLRTPATAVKQLLGMIIEGLRGPVPEDLRPLLVKAYDSNERQISIVNNLLKVAQLDAGKVSLRKSPADIERLIRDILDEQQDTIRGRKQVVTVRIPPMLKPLLVDTEHLRMALGNMVDNASKYSHESGKITIALHQTPDETVVRISDNGVGIGPGDIDKLFNKFMRIPNELSQKTGGNGLGLYWSHKIIVLHGGRVNVESAQNQGTTFTVHLPNGAVGA